MSFYLYNILLWCKTTYISLFSLHTREIVKKPFKIPFKMSCLTSFLGVGYVMTMKLRAGIRGRLRVADNLIWLRVNKREISTLSPPSFRFSFWLRKILEIYNFHMCSDSFTRRLWLCFDNNMCPNKIIWLVFNGLKSWTIQWYVSFLPMKKIFLNSEKKIVVSKN